MNTQALHAFLNTKATVYRDKGIAVPPRDTHRLADVWFFRIEVEISELDAFKPIFLQMIQEYPDTIELQGGPSYVTAAREDGFADQGLTLAAFGIGEMLGLWHVVTPATMGITGGFAEKMAGGGMVHITGYKPNPSNEPPQSV